MKDSRAGAFGVTALITFSAFEISAFIELSKISIVEICAALYCMPIIGRLCMVFVIGFFPYARPTGMGKAFSDYTNSRTIFFAFVEGILLLSPAAIFSERFLIAIPAAIIFSVAVTFCFGKFSVKKIGGVTGDIYGAASMLAELTSVIIFLITGGGIF